MYSIEDIPLHKVESGKHIIYGLPPKCSYLIESSTNEGKTYNEYCVFDLQNGEEKFLVCNDQKELKARILAISMIASVSFLVVTAVIIWMRNKDKLHGAMTLNMVLMLLIYFVMHLVANFVPSSEFQCHVSMVSIYHATKKKALALCFHLNLTQLSSQSLLVRKSGRRGRPLIT